MSEGRPKREGNEVEGDKTAQGKDLGLWLGPASGRTLSLWIPVSFL